MATGSVITGTASVTNYVDPISRIEGHLGVNLQVGSGQHITEADVHGNLWRGFENFLVGREPNDAITFVQRICGVCPVPHGMTATFNTESVIGYNQNFQTWAQGKQQLAADGVTVQAVPAGFGVPEKALHIRNIVLALEFLMSSITHFYHLAAPSYVQGPAVPPWTPYFGINHYHPFLRGASYGTDGGSGHGVLPLDTAGYSADLWSAVIKQYVKALRIRRLTFEAGAMFSGRMPMTSALIAGGTGFDKNENLSVRCTKAQTLTTEIGKFVVKEYVPVVLALGALYPNFDNALNAATTDAVPYGGGTLWTAASPDNVTGTIDAGWGAGVGNFLAWGGFPQTNGQLALSRGYKLGAAAVQTISVTDVQNNLKEDIAHARYQGSLNATATITDPGTEVRTIPVRDQVSKYSWLKAPRWSGNAMEVGPMARMFIMGKIQTGVAYTTTVGIGTANYVKSTGTGLDPAAIEADLAVALVRMGLAELWVGGSLVPALPATKALIDAAYTDPTAEIRGVILTWILALKGGLSTMDRLRARAIESFVLVQKLAGGLTKSATDVAFDNTGWIHDLSIATGDTYRHVPVPTASKTGFGAVEAPRGALMHMCTINGGKIERYQCIVPTTWNGSPKDTGLNRGPIEEAMIGAKMRTDANMAATSTPTGWDATYKTQAGPNANAQSGVEALRIAQSFDPCIACAVH